jgi:hypothetical protein
LAVPKLTFPESVAVPPPVLFVAANTPETLETDDCAAVVRYAPADCRAVVMFDASPNVIEDPFVEADRLDPTLRLIAPEDPLTLLTYAVGFVYEKLAAIALPADV